MHIQKWCATVELERRMLLLLPSPRNDVIKYVIAPVLWYCVAFYIVYSDDQLPVW